MLKYRLAISSYQSFIKNVLVGVLNIKRIIVTQCEDKMVMLINLSKISNHILPYLLEYFFDQNKVSLLSISHNSVE